MRASQYDEQSITIFKTLYFALKNLAYKLICLMISIEARKEFEHGTVFNQRHDLLISATGYTRSEAQKVPTAMWLDEPSVVT